MIRNRIFYRRLVPCGGALASPQGIGSHARKIILLGGPLLLGQVTHYFHQIADSAMLGHFGDDSLELAAVGIAGLATWILMTLLWPLSSGVQALASRRYGRERRESKNDRFRTGQVLDNGLVVTFCAGAIAAGGSGVFGPILSRLVDSPKVLALSLEYISIIRFGLLPMGFFLVCQGFLGAINKTRAVMYAGVLSNLLNIFLNWLLIFGRFGFPALGVRGAALGTVFSTAIAALYLMIVLLLGEGRREYGVFRFRVLDKRVQADILRVAWPQAVQNAVALLIFLVFQTLVESYGAVYLAATHSIFSFMRLNKTLIGGFARAASIAVGNALGRGDRAEAQAVMRAAILLGGCFALAVALFVLGARGTIAAFFTNDPATQDVLRLGLLFFTGFFFLEALGFTFEIVFTGNGFGSYVLVSEVVTNLVFILGATLVARFFYPHQILWAWFSFGLYQVFHALFLAAGFVRGRWLDVRVESGSCHPRKEAV
ncbi:putative efflux protein, MATE family [Alkalispirochaeta americana]|uniref:Multidrug-efflux transporter n=1 Tax=Alkalispirochaeta americana TaxID=159291 RepID=A0A1N6SZH8_9SPIO|nr:MATE family efflux transporter [Alkalispirochaeta americana]SIQ46472.1 putative efflux protein, MATE family [Alkalispirochaeta americana]